MNNIEHFNDIFDIIDDNHDPLEYTNDELNKYFFNGHFKFMINEEETIDPDNIDNDMNDSEVMTCRNTEHKTNTKTLFVTFR